MCIVRAIMDEASDWFPGPNILTMVIFLAVDQRKSCSFSKPDERVLEKTIRALLISSVFASAVAAGLNSTPLKHGRRAEPEGEKNFSQR